MAQASKALICDCVHYADGASAARAANGEYDITGADNGGVAFCNCATQNRFTLSLDAVLQHLFEGRMRLIGGGRLPAPAYARARR